MPRVVDLYTVHPSFTSQYTRRFGYKDQFIFILNLSFKIINLLYWAVLLKDKFISPKSKSMINIELFFMVLIF